MSLENLLKSTNAYKIIHSDKVSGHLSHAYLVLCQDEIMADEYMNILARLITCDSDDVCGKCRQCKLIKERKYSDCRFYPINEQKFKVEDVEDIIADSYVKPYEGDKKIFVIEKAETVNVQSQNKLLKTLEEPPANVYILLCATSEYPILPTVKSRVKKTTIQSFTEEQLFEECKGKYSDLGRLKTAILFAEGRYGNVDNLYNKDSAGQMKNFCLQVLQNMQKSSDIPEYSNNINKDNIAEFIKVMKFILGSAMRLKTNVKPSFYDEDSEKKILKATESYDIGALIAVIEILGSAERSLTFNGNVTMLADSIFFGLLEEKYKWQKS